MSEEEDSQEKKEKNNNSSNGITVTNFRGSPKVLQISKGNYYYLINRENYDLTKIMMLIDYNRLSTLGQKFREYDGGIEKIIFCTLLTNILKTDKMLQFDKKLEQLLSKTEDSYVVIKFPSFQKKVIYEEAISKNYIRKQAYYYYSYYN